MYVIQIADVVDILKNYNIYEYIEEIELKAYYQELGSECMVIYARSNMNEYIIKIIRDSKLSLELENRQAKFSEALRKKEFNVPKKYAVNEMYVFEMEIDDECMFVQVEDYFGEDVKIIERDVIKFLGNFLGTSHSLSLKNNWSLCEGSAYKTMIYGKATFDKIWDKKLESYINQDYLKQIKDKHDFLMNKICKIWNTLPRAAVHGDLSVDSNIVRNEVGLGVIDFNLAGDECLLGDMLISWYSSRYNYLMAVGFDLEYILELKKNFFECYIERRAFTNIETQYLPIISYFLNGIYYIRLISKLHELGYKKQVSRLVVNIVDNYNKEDAFIDMRIGYEE